jgi:ABC-type Na+ transport system ATPase subunit NatA
MSETRGLRRTFRSRRSEVVAVDGVDLRVEAGEVFGFLGPNGAGKTTTLRMLATLLPPTGGDAWVAGCDLRREREPFVREASCEDDSVRLYVEQGEAAMPDILRALDRAGLELRTIALSRPSLDDVFLRQTGRSLRDAA